MGLWNSLKGSLTRHSVRGSTRGGAAKKEIHYTIVNKSKASITVQIFDEEPSEVLGDADGDSSSSEEFEEEPLAVEQLLPRQAWTHGPSSEWVDCQVGTIIVHTEENMWCLDASRLNDGSNQQQTTTTQAIKDVSFLIQKIGGHDELGHSSRQHQMDTILMVQESVEAIADYTSEDGIIVVTLTVQLDTMDVEPPPMESASASTSPKKEKKKSARIASPVRTNSKNIPVGLMPQRPALQRGENGGIWNNSKRISGSNNSKNLPLQRAGTAPVESLSNSDMRRRQMFRTSQFSSSSKFANQFSSSKEFLQDLDL